MTTDVWEFQEEKISHLPWTEAVNNTAATVKIVEDMYAC